MDLDIKNMYRNIFQIHFDGWPAYYDFWVEDVSLDIHPPTWCEKTRHSLMPPLSKLTSVLQHHILYVSVPQPFLVPGTLPYY